MNIFIKRNVSGNTLYMYFNLKYCLLLCQSGWTLRISMENVKRLNANEAREMPANSDYLEGLLQSIVMQHTNISLRKITNPCH